MKSTCHRPTALHKLIRRATSAPADDVDLIEHIMRSDVFHSTLDWQTEDQLAHGARQAFALLEANREMYAMEQAAGQAVWQQMASGGTQGKGGLS